MSVNMSYCRYENTSNAFEELEELIDLDFDGLASLSKSELRAAKRLISTIYDIAECYDRDVFLEKLNNAISETADED